MAMNKNVTNEQLQARLRKLQEEHKNEKYLGDHIKQIKNLRQTLNQNRMFPQETTPSQIEQEYARLRNVHKNNPEKLQNLQKEYRFMQEKIRADVQKKEQGLLDSVQHFTKNAVTNHQAFTKQYTNMMQKHTNDPQKKAAIEKEFVQIAQHHELRLLQRLRPKLQHFTTNQNIESSYNALKRKHANDPQKLQEVEQEYKRLQEHTRRVADLKALREKKVEQEEKIETVKKEDIREKTAEAATKRLRLLQEERERQQRQQRQMQQQQRQIGIQIPASRVQRRRVVAQQQIRERTQAAAMQRQQQQLRERTQAAAMQRQQQQRQQVKEQIQKRNMQIRQVEMKNVQKVKSLEQQLRKRRMQQRTLLAEMKKLQRFIQQGRRLQIAKPQLRQRVSRAEQRYNLLRIQFQKSRKETQTLQKQEMAVRKAAAQLASVLKKDQRALQ